MSGPNVTAPAEPGRMVIRLPALQREVEISKDWLLERNALVAKSQEIKTITANGQFEAASFVLSQITKVSNSLETMRKQLAKPFQDAAACVKDASDKARDPLEQEKTRLKALLGTYAEEQRKAQEAERRRIEEEQRRQIEQQAAERAAQEDLGIAQDEVFTPAVTAPAPVVQMPKSSAVRTVERVAWTVVNEDAVPRGYMIVDPRKVNDHVREHGDFIKAQVKDGAGETLVPGIKFTIETTVAAR